MSTRRTRAASRREESPDQPREDPVARQTRSSSRRAGPPSDASPQSKEAKPIYPKIPQRGTRRRARRRSIESVATNDFPKSSAEHATPEPTVMEDPKPLQVEHAPSSDIESLDDSYERLQDLLDFDLPKLSCWCDQVFAALAPLHLPEATIEQRKELKIARKRFNSARRPLAEDSTVYIDVASSDLPRQADPHAYDKVRKSARRANIISLLLSLHDLERSKQDASHFIQCVDDDFHLFLDPYSPTQLEGYSLAFRLRCRRLVELFGEELKTEPLVMATTLFCEQSVSTSEEAAQPLREGPFRELGQEGQEEHFMNTPFFKEQMDALVSNLSLSTNAEIEQSLDATYPRDGLFEELRSWASHEYSSLVPQVRESDPPTSQNGGQPNNGTQSEEHEGLFVGDGHEPDDGSGSDSSSEHEECNQLEPLTNAQSYIKDPGTLAAVRRSEASIPKKTRIEPPSRLMTAKGGITESQIQAVRDMTAADVLGDYGDHDGDYDVVPTGTRTAYARSRSGSHELGATTKRTHPGGDAESADEGDFDNNKRVPNKERRQRHGDSMAPRPAPKRSRLAVIEGRNGDRPQPLNATPDDNNMTGDDLKTLRKAARANILAHKGRAPQVRERWSTADTNRLLDLIADPGISCSWAEMERKGNISKDNPDGFETHRSQQAIRDKARNLKKGYLCADAILPCGFDFVFLGKKEKDEVIASGRNPDRMEDDIDERGRVTCNLWGDRES